MDILTKGGPMMYFILACSVIAVSIFISKFVHLHKAQINIGEFMSGLRNELVNRRIAEAVSICEETPGPAANVLKAGITHHTEGALGMEAAMHRASIYEVSRMERGITGLATIAVISPLFGFLGTVLGLINTFQVVAAQSGMLTGPEISNGMWQALLAPAFGLAVAIPAYIMYNYFVSRVNRIVRDVEIASEELVGILGAG